MPYIVKQSEKTDYPKPQDGEYNAICYKLIDTGSHMNSYDKLQPTVRLYWELHGDNLVGEGTGIMNDGRPFSVDRKFNPSLGGPDKSTKFREFLEGWRGRPFTPEELKGFDLTRLVGVPCRLTLATQPNKDGTKSYQNIVKASPVMKGTPAFQMVNPATVFLIDEWDDEVFKSLPDFIQKEIMDSPESNNKPKASVNAQAPFDDDQSIPF
jgi:hypothetical protein